VKEFNAMKRIGLLFCLVFTAGVFCTSFAHAQTRKPTAEETKLIRNCVEEVADDMASQEECTFKLVVDPCVEKDGSNLGTADCYRIERAIWDDILNENYKKLMAAVDDPKDQTKLKEMQRAWIAFRDTTCDFYWHKIHGSMAVPMTAACQLRETSRRAFLLAGLLLM
jgi:uncharacterized protein YecT (DUF1311 family)